MLSSIAFALAAIPAHVGEELQSPPQVSLFSVEQVRHVANFDYVVGPHTHLYTHEEGVAWWDTNGRLINFLPRAQLAERESGVQIIREKIDDRWYRFALMPDRSLKSVTGYMLRDGSEIVARDNEGNDFHPTHDPVLNTQYRMLDSNANTLNTHDLVVVSGSYEVTLEKPEGFRFHAPTEHLLGFLDSTDHHIIGQFRGEYDGEQTGETHSFIWSRSGELVDWRGLFDPSTSPHAPTEIRSVQAVGLLPNGTIVLEVTLETTAPGQIRIVLALVDGRGTERPSFDEGTEGSLYARGTARNRPGSFSRRIEWLPFPERPGQSYFDRRSGGGNRQGSIPTDPVWQQKLLFESSNESGDILASFSVGWQDTPFLWADGRWINMLDRLASGDSGAGASLFPTSRHVLLRTRTAGGLLTRIVGY